MPIIYGLVSRQENVLAEYTASKGNFSTVTRALLNKIPDDDSKLSYLYDEHVFHYVVSSGFTYLCMTDKSFARSSAFKFLSELEDRFIDTYGDRGRTAVAYAFNADFQRVINKLIDDFNQREKSNDKLGQVQSHLDSVKEVMIRNIDVVLDRGERIELLVERSEAMEQSAFVFQRTSTNLRRHYWWKNIKLWVILIVFVLLIIYVILAISCGMDLSDC